MFVPSLYKPFQNVGHKYLLCSPLEALCISLFLPPPNSNKFVYFLMLCPLVCLSQAPVSSIVLFRRRANLRRQASATFSMAISHWSGCLCFFSLSYQVLGQSARGHPSSYCGRRGTCCLLGVIMDHTWLCSSSSPRPGASMRGLSLVSVQ